MKLYHRTSHALEILEHGFRDGEGAYGITKWWSGVWLSDTPLAENEGAFGNVVIPLEIPEDVVTEWEWVEDWKPYRGFLVPADVVNRYWHQ